MAAWVAEVDADEAVDVVLEDDKAGCCCCCVSESLVDDEELPLMHVGALTLADEETSLSDAFEMDEASS